MKVTAPFIPRPKRLDTIVHNQDDLNHTVVFNKWKDNTLSDEIGLAHVYRCRIMDIEEVAYAAPYECKITEDPEEIQNLAITLFETESECPFTGDMLSNNIATINKCNHTFWHKAGDDYVIFVNFFKKRSKSKS
jgi:hypothetical protein